jgi:hypothetical protein
MKSPLGDGQKSMIARIDLAGIVMRTVDFPL